MVHCPDDIYQQKGDKQIRQHDEKAITYKTQYLANAVW